MRASAAVQAFLVLGALACSSTPRPDVVIPKAEAEDHMVQVGGEQELQDFIHSVQPAVDEARKSFPEAKARYLAGLPEGSHFFVTTRLWDRAGRMEQAFVFVDAIRGQVVDGRIWSEIAAVEGFSRGDVIKVSESEVIDWTILDADGGEEGNYVGKLIDKLQGVSH